ncbi:Uncharacterized protein T310_5811 [Rasamsonia emersonii CBS 393.64]|uniref:ER transporter 6TM N-terminal domain-containing protein n=1 Tax=Rasamsonia emersonii (strain ATCC 16479 / CBS 393.64 / IMI 116815) TaxID=1408163 RepID=A0A0F4YPH4_RASE3|nr:Uncharacterized protein T310_5811 [Rasamsonia emersonii CBS 393.64]KKA20157.1 Uncharacterized protein T310_5811 [Rasamsonia emersonii CBS 393.64]
MSSRSTSSDSCAPESSESSRIHTSQRSNGPEKKTKEKQGFTATLKALWAKTELDKQTVLMMIKGAIPPTISVAIYQSTPVANTFTTLGYFIYMINTVRAKYPQFNLPVIMYSMVANVSTTYAPQFGTMSVGITFLRHLMGAFFTGLAISTGVSFLIFPVTSRQVVFRQMTAYIGALRGALKAHGAYFESMERKDMFGRVETYDMKTEKRGKHGKKIYSPEAEAIKTAVSKIGDLHGRLHGELPFAKREIALGNLGPEDLSELFGQLRRTMVPIVGLGSVVDIFERLSEYNKWNKPLEDGHDLDIHSDATRQRIVHEWNDIMRAVHEPFAHIIQVMDEGLQHVTYRLRLAKPPKKKASPQPTTAEDAKDVEATAAATAPGDDGFAEYLEMKSDEFYRGKLVALRVWCQEKGIKVPPDFFEHPENVSISIPEDINLGLTRERNERQLYLLLYMEHLLYSASRAILDFVRFADAKAASGKVSRTRLIIPGNKRLKKWVLSAFKVQDGHDDDDIGDIHSQSVVLYLGEAYKTRKDPEHLPPENTMQKIGDWIRLIPRLLRSSESAFGFRVACATMSVAIIDLLHDTQPFFVRQRLLWAMIMVAISMSPTAGQSIASFVLRVLGTVIAIVGTFLIWYIPDGKTPGVIVFLFLYVAIAYYIPIKKPRYTMMGMINIVTVTMIVGYELEVRKVGEKVATSNGQDYYPIYLLAPYRLAIVAGGLAVAFIWTVFPFPISEHSVLRKSLGASLYLLANYYSIIHETVTARARGDEGDMTLKTSAGRRLEKARHRVYAKQILMLSSLRTYSDFLKWEVPIGGRFPKRQYDTIIACVRNIVNYVTLVEYASKTFAQMSDRAHESESAWYQDFKSLMVTANLTTHEITSLLSLLSASIMNQQPLPPYLKTPRPYAFSEKLKELDKDILSISHSAEPGYAAFSVLQVSTRCIIGDLEKLIAVACPATSGRLSENWISPSTP